MVALSGIVVASKKAPIGLPEIDVSLMGAARRTLRLFSHSRLLRMMLTDLHVDGAELYRGHRQGMSHARAADQHGEATRQDGRAQAPGRDDDVQDTLNAVDYLSRCDGYHYGQDMTAAIGKTEDAKAADRGPPEARAGVQ